MYVEKIKEEIEIKSQNYEGESKLCSIVKMIKKKVTFLVKSQIYNESVNIFR